jgi:hypothetical protein
MHHPQNGTPAFQICKCLSLVASGIAVGAGHWRGRRAHLRRKGGAVFGGVGWRASHSARATQRTGPDRCRGTGCLVGCRAPRSLPTHLNSKQHSVLLAMPGSRLSRREGQAGVAARFSAAGGDPSFKPPSHMLQLLSDSMPTSF